MTSSIFLSHNFQDKEFVRRLAKDLSRHRVKFWLDEAEIKVGDSLIEKIQQGISDMDYLGVVLSPNSVESEWVKRELNAALNMEIRGRKVKVLPLLYKHCEIPVFLIDKAYADFTNEPQYDLALSRLLENLGVDHNSLTRAPEGELDAPPIAATEHRKSVQFLGERELELRFSSGIFPELEPIKKYENEVVQSLINAPKLRSDFAIDPEAISVVMGDDFVSAISDATDHSTESKKRIELLDGFLHQGVGDIVRYSINHPHVSFFNVSITFFAGGIFSMMLAEAMRAGSGRRFPHSNCLFSRAFGSPFFQPDVDYFYDEILFAIDVFRPSSGPGTRIHVRRESELGEFFSRGLGYDEFSAWASPGWCSRYLIPQMVARKYLLGEPIIEDFSGYKIGPA